MLVSEDNTMNFYQSYVLWCFVEYMIDYEVFVLQRITIPEIMCHQWFTKNLPRDLALGSDPIYDNDREDQPAQSLEEVMHILNEARMVHHAPHGSLPLIDINDDVDEWEEKDPIPDMIHDAEVEDEADVEAEFEMDEVEYFDVEECCEFDNSSTNMR